MATIESRIAGNKIRNEAVSDYISPATNTDAGYVDEKGRRLVEMQEKMRSAARFSELEDKMSMDKIEKSLIESNPNFIGPKQPIQPQQDYSNLSNAALKTVDWEGRKDANGNLIVYDLPSGDEGGSQEIAGINNRYHPEAFDQVSSLPPQERAKAAAGYIQKYTAPLVSLLPAKIQPFVQDMAFNRGMGGATKYLQQGLNSLGLNVKVDGAIGPQTIQAINQADPHELMREASKAQLMEERAKAAANPARQKFIPGLENRIANRLSLFGTV
ncbi:MAG: hypothetical protein EBY22_13270 [Gammaproteobacteria bacterium]|nr:hypothetical protein [Gammaproteobacteria bacterium]